MTSPKTGHDFHLYYNSANHATPTWVEIPDVMDLDKSEETTMADFLTRASRQKVGLPTSLSAGLEFGMAYDVNSTVFDALRAFYDARSVNEYFVADGLANTNGTQGFRFGGIISSFPDSQPLEDVASNDITITPGYFEEANARVEWDFYEVGA